MVKSYVFNGIKAVNINNLPEEAWRIIAGDDIEAGDVWKVYQNSAFFRACVDKRAAAISRLPRDIMRGDEAVDEGEIEILKDLDKLLYQTEVALTLFGFAYIFKMQNRMRPIDLRWLAPKSIMPKYDEMNGLIGFERTTKAGAKELEVEDLLYFWTPPIANEIGPGEPVGKAALNAAGVLEGSSLFSKQFFDRGAIYPMLLSVEGNPPRAEMDKLESWWKRLTRGVKDAWNTIAIKATVKPEIIGPPIEQMAMKDLTDLQRENVAAALCVPLSLVLSNAANFATAHQDAINFYDLCVIPEATLIADVWNNQLLNDMGLELVFQPERLEVFQKQNLESSDTLVQLVGSNIIDENEARSILGFEEREDLPEDDPEEPLVMQLPQPQPALALPPGDMRSVDLEKWQRKAKSALKSGGTAAAQFESDHISYTETNQIMNELSLCFSDAEVKAVFDGRHHSH